MRLLPATMLLGSLASAAEQRMRSPDGKLALVVSDDAGLREFAADADSATPKTEVETTRYLGYAATLSIK